jgi:hypothetical protein
MAMGKAVVASLKHLKVDELVRHATKNIIIKLMLCTASKYTLAKLNLFLLNYILAFLNRFVVVVKMQHVIT